MQFSIENIVKDIRRGDQNAFRKLVEEYQQYAFNLAFRIIYNEDEARDIVQDSFIKMWNKILDYDSDVKFTTWMYSIVTNTAIDALRSKNRKKQVNIDNINENFYQPDHVSIEKKLDNEKLSDMIKLLADDLPERQRLVFVLRDIQELSSQETKDILKINETQVKSNLYHARKNIKDKMKTLL